jgi:hypothetical protein
LVVERIAAVRARAQAPTAFHGLPEVLLVGKTLQAGSQMNVPVELKLFDK